MITKFWVLAGNGAGIRQFHKSFDGFDDAKNHAVGLLHERDVNHPQQLRRYLDAQVVQVVDSLPVVAWDIEADGSFRQLEDWEVGL